MLTLYSAKIKDTPFRRLPDSQKQTTDVSFDRINGKIFCLKGD